MASTSNAEGSAAAALQVSTVPTPVIASKGLAHSRFIQSGDLAIVFVSRDKTPFPIQVTSGECLINAWGAFEHDAMIGRPFGSRVYSRGRKGFLYLLRPSPELWTLALPHRTQILYAPDMSFITLQLALGPGSRVIEAGTGSGSFTHFLARTVGREHQWRGGRGWKGDGQEEEDRDARDGSGAGRGKKRKIDEDGKSKEVSEPLPKEPDAHVGTDDGRVWSFEFNAVRVEKARSEFEAHGLTRTVSLRHRNVCKDGFGLTGVADAIFLDVPAPWEAISAAVDSLRPDVLGRICCFSPCIEQVLKTAQALWEGGWSDVETYESLVRTHESQAHPRTAPMSSIDEAIVRIKEVEGNKAVRRELQIERAKQLRKAKAEAEAAAAAAAEAGQLANGSTEVANGESVVKEEEEQAEDQDAEMEDEVAQAENEAANAPAPAAAAKSSSNGTDNAPFIFLGDSRPGKSKEHRRLTPANVYSRAYPEMRGHTSYLTFATLRPRVVIPIPTKDEAAKAEAQPSTSAAAEATSTAAPVEAATA